MTPEEIKLSDGDLSWARDEICREQKCEDGLCAGLQFERARVVTAIEAVLRENKQGWFPPEGLDRNDVVQLFIDLRDDILAGHQEVSK